MQDVRWLVRLSRQEIWDWSLVGPGMGPQGQALGQGCTRGCPGQAPAVPGSPLAPGPQVRSDCCPGEGVTMYDNGG